MAAFDEHGSNSQCHGPQTRDGVKSRWHSTKRGRSDRERSERVNRDEIEPSTRRARPREGVGEPQLDEGLPADTNPPGLAIDCVKQIDREIDIHSLHFTARAAGSGEIKMGAQVASRVVYFIEAGGRQRSSLRSTALLRLGARGGLR